MWTNSCVDVISTILILYAVIQMGDMYTLGYVHMYVSRLCIDSRTGGQYRDTCSHATNYELL